MLLGSLSLILGEAVSDLVKSLLDNIINPLLGILLNQAIGLTEASFTLAGAAFKHGALVNIFINFCVIAAVVYFGIKKLGLDRLDKKA